MERKKISNFTIILITVVLIIAVIITKTVMVINERHEERLIYSMHSKVEYSAQRCYLEDICKDVITLQVLYDNGYLKEEVINPISKEVIDHNLEIRYEEEKVVINW